MLKDANGTVLGPFAVRPFLRKPSPPPNFPFPPPFARPIDVVYLNAPDGPVAATSATPTGFSESFAFFHTSNDCSGQRLTFSNESTAFAFTGIQVYPPAFYQIEVGVSGGTLFYTPASGSTQSVNSKAQSVPDAASCGAGVFISPNTCCLPASFTDTLGPVGTLDISGFVPPFHLEVQ